MERVRLRVEPPWSGGIDVQRRSLVRAALGAAFGEVFAVLRETVKDVVRKVHMFKLILKRLESTLNHLTPMEWVDHFGKGTKTEAPVNSSLNYNSPKGLALHKSTPLHFF
ncbi:hypothetical protein CFP56_042116 [Quercus suber]|uniref:RPW8 domain-containing protein n=1 Tax=Quercus suber TaxID=58331 RepID=A0AAW0M9J0_QUESU